jgi:hypothetical protein
VDICRKRAALFFLAASRRTWVPRMFVRRKRAGSSMLRSTCVSAAKFTIASGSKSATMLSTAFASQMSARRNRYRSSSSTSSRLARFPA